MRLEPTPAGCRGGILVYIIGLSISFALESFWPFVIMIVISIILELVIDKFKK